MRIMLKRDMLNRCYDINIVKKNYMRKVNGLRILLTYMLVLIGMPSDKC
jgi:hypothetical protein